MGNLRDALINSPALNPLDYELDSPVILVVDTSYIAVGYFLCQCSPEGVKHRNYSRFGSITLNEREARFSQAKLKYMVYLGHYVLLDFGLLVFGNWS